MQVIMEQSSSSPGSMDSHRLPFENEGSAPDLDATARRRERRQTIGWLLEFTLVYAFIAGVIASAKPFWTDELFTFYLSRLPTFGEIWKALSTGADQHPPLFYMIENLSLRLFGESELALRLPSMFGFWLASISVFAFVARRATAICGYIAMLVPCSTGLFFYAYEARGYALVFGLTSAALLCWQLAGEHRYRWFAAPLLGLCLALAVGCHYYAVLAIPPLAVGEAVRWYRTRRFTLTIWLALAAPALTLAFSFPIIVSARGFAGRFWAIPRWWNLLVVYSDLVASPGLVAGLLGWLFLSLAILVVRPAHSPEPRRPLVRDYPEEIVAVWGLIAAPLLAMILAKTVTHGFHFRYVIFVGVGLIVQLAWMAYSISRFRPRVDKLICGFVIVCSLAYSLNQMFFYCQRRGDVALEQAWLNRFPTKPLPIVCSNSETFYRCWHYGSPALRQRLVYVADPDRAYRFLGHDTVDRCILTLRPWFGVRAERYDDFLRANPTFFVVGELEPWQWIARTLPADGFHVEFLGARNGLTYVCLARRRSLPQAHDKPLAVASDRAISAGVGSNKLSDAAALIAPRH